MTYVASQGGAGYDFHHDLAIVSNEIKGFIASLYYLFHDLEDCDWQLMLQELREIDVKTATLLDDIDQRQLLLYVMDPGSFPDVDTEEFMNALSSSKEDTEGDADLSSIANGRTFNAAPNKTPDIQLAKKTFNASARSKSRTPVETFNSKSNERSYTFGVVDGDMEEAEAAFENLYTNTRGTNLYRAKNYENLHGLFDFE